MPIIGVDFSQHQGTDLPWAAWVAGGVKFCIGRASIGYRQDAAYPRHLQQARLAGVKYRGAYHVILRSDNEVSSYDPVRQAQVFIERLQANEATIGVLDIEANGVTENLVRAFCDYYDATSPYPLMLYGNLSLGLILGSNKARYANYPLWAADYGPGFITSTPPVGNYPRTAGIGRLSLWQFAGDNGRLAPYTKPIDLSIFAGNETELATLFNVSQAPPPSPKQRMITLIEELRELIYGLP